MKLKKVPAPRIFDFPANPSVGDQVTAPDGRVWEWNGVVWLLVAPGGGGGGTTLQHMTYTQTPPDTDWAIGHNFNFRYVLVQVVNTSGDTVIPDVAYTSVNRVDLIFANPVAGVAIIRR